MEKIPFYAVWVAAALHAGFAAGELLPWQDPCLFHVLSMDKSLMWSRVPKENLDFVISVVHNAGVYNGIVAAGLVAAAQAWRPDGPHAATLIATVLLVGAGVAGLVGALTLGPLVILQTVVAAFMLLGVGHVAAREFCTSTVSKVRASRRYRP